jgi:hypothetical protein
MESRLSENLEKKKIVITCAICITENRLVTFSSESPYSNKNVCAMEPLTTRVIRLHNMLVVQYFII